VLESIITQFETKPLGEVPLKGKRAPMPIFELSARKE